MQAAAVANVKIQAAIAVITQADKDIADQKTECAAKAKTRAEVEEHKLAAKKLDDKIKKAETYVAQLEAAKAE